MNNRPVFEESLLASPDELAGPLLSAGSTAREISVEQAERIDRLLGEFCSEIDLDFSALLDDSGGLLGWAVGAGGEAGPVNEMIVECSAALAMGTFAASQALAAQLGGDDSRELIHHAGAKSFYLCEVSEGLALFAVWSGDVAPGFLRTRARSVAKKIQMNDYKTVVMADSSEGVATEEDGGIGQSPRTLREADRLRVQHAAAGARPYVFEIG